MATAGDSVNLPPLVVVAKLKKKIATAKGLFTRTETKIKTLQVKGNETLGNTLLEKLDTYSQEVNDLYDQWVDILGEREKSSVEDIMNAVDIDHHHRATACLMQFTALPVELSPQGPGTRPPGAREPPRIQF